jgi:hypothetical protein
MVSVMNVLGFIAGIIIGVSAIVVGSLLPRASPIAFGVWALLAVALAWFTGASAEPGGNPFKQELKAKFKYVPAWAWWIIALGLVVVIVVAIIEGLG